MKFTILYKFPTLGVTALQIGGAKPSLNWPKRNSQGCIHFETPTHKADCCYSLKYSSMWSELDESDEVYPLVFPLPTLIQSGKLGTCTSKYYICIHVYV